MSIQPEGEEIRKAVKWVSDQKKFTPGKDLNKIIGEKSQIIMITHNKKSMEFASTLFGITMEKKGVSKVVSVNLT